MTQKLSVIDEYLEYQSDSVKKYGEKTIVFMEVGSFFEAYATTDQGYNLSEISKLINVIRTKKNNKGETVSTKNPYMLGFPKTSLLERLKILTDNGISVVIIRQITNPPEKVIRKITGIYTPGTNILSYTSDTNFITALYIKDEKQINSKNIISIGISSCDITTGHVYTFESYSSIDDDKKSLDNVSQFIQTYHPKELLIHIDSDKITLEYIKTYLDINDIFIKKFDTLNKCYFKISYQCDVIKNIYKECGMINPIEYIGMEKMTYAIISFMMLFNYINSIDSQIIEKIEIPEIFFSTPKLYLGNNAQIQLNIFNVNQSHTENCNKKFKCLFDVINNTSTALGKRYLQNILNNPLTNIDELQNIYDITEQLITDKNYKKFDSYLTQLYDIEKIYRKMIIGNISFDELYQFYTSLIHIKKIFKSINCNEKLFEILCHSKNTICKNVSKLINFLETTFEVENLKTCQNNDKISYYKSNIHNDIDDLYNKLNDKINLIENLRYELSMLIGNETYITTKKTDRDDYYYAITKIRAKQLKEKLEQMKNIKIGSIKIKVSKLCFKDNISGSCKIFAPFLNDNSDDIYSIKNNIAQLLNTYFKSDINNIISSFGKYIKRMIHIISELDYYVSNAKTSIMYGYVKPTIKSENFGYVECKQLRHPIIERIIDYEYIPHDLNIGNRSLKGMLLYGLNSSGKSSMMKALGISVIMAQCGMYVPAKEFIYSPYTSLFTRIFGNDNIFRELSSFGVEMMELKAIWKRSDEKTLVIGDEVCRGTEQISGSSIVASTLIKLSKQQSTFIFATHLHEIMNLKSIQNIPTIKPFYLSVSYDEQNDRIIFDRILKEGTGEKIYGITVAKYIIQDKEFSDLTVQIKNELLGKDETNNNIVSTKQSKYNNNVYVSKCSICGKELNAKDEGINLDTHHIHHQKDCDDDGNVKNMKYIKKNSNCNLVVLCKSCHTKHHNGDIDIEKFVSTSNGKILKHNQKNKK